MFVIRQMDTFSKHCNQPNDGISHYCLLDDTIVADRRPSKRHTQTDFKGRARARENFPK